MTIEFTPAFTSTPVVEFTWPAEPLQQLFDNCRTWSNTPYFEGMGYKGLSKRLVKGDHEFSKKEWTQLTEAMNESKLQLVKDMLSIDTKNRWPNIPEQIANQLQVYMFLVTDLEGYSMPAHIDNRSVFAAGYLNVFNNEPLTVVSTQKPSLLNRSKYYAPGKQGQGVLWLNTENSWHWVKKSKKLRRSVFFSIQIVPWN